MSNYHNGYIIEIKIPLLRTTNEENDILTDALQILISSALKEYKPHDWLNIYISGRDMSPIERTMWITQYFTNIREEEQ